MAATFALLVAFITALLQPGHALECYSYVTETPNASLPIDAKSQTCIMGETFCMKFFHMKTTKDDKTGKEVKVTSFSWGCAHFGMLLSSTARPDGKFEFTTGSRDGDTHITEYTRACLCKGDRCNSHSMDDQCNDEPEFIHYCYSDDRTHKSPAPALPLEAVTVPCTATQACVKYSYFNNDTMGHADYQWGCMTAPQGRCNFAGNTHDGEIFEKACMCCGDLCNGHQFDDVLANDTSCGSPLSAKCYVGTSVTPTMPTNAKVEICQLGETMCMKSYEMSITKENGMEVRQIKYNWGCAPFGKLFKTTVKCGGKMEATTGAKESPTTTSYHFTRTCTCCGDNCNDASMNSVCNEDPHFISQCYSADSMLTGDDPILPISAVKVPCTAEQACMKYTHYNPVEKDYHYQWGCLSTPDSYCNWGGSAYDGQILEKACMCCGELCNGQLMDIIIAENSDCSQTVSRKCFNHKTAFAKGKADPKIPPTAVASNCMFGENMCMKMHTVTKTTELGKEWTEEAYEWGCAHFGDLLMTNAKCGGYVEIGTAETVATAKSTTYQKACFCCGDNCNNANMDASCTEEPKFTHQCAASDTNEQVWDPVLPSTAVSIPCTENQSCLKLSHYEQDTKESHYQWGCVTPPSHKCEQWSGAKYEGQNTFLKSCMCCGDNCNGKPMDTVIAKTDYCSASPPTTTKKPTELRCFDYKATVPVGTVPHLPIDAPLAQCIYGETQCMKSYQLTTKKDNSGKETKEITYTWGCATYGHMLVETALCNAVLEIGTGGPTNDGNNVVHHTRSCMCCGDSCNDASMDHLCNDEPKFTKNCYSHDTEESEDSDARLPANAVAIPCTENQACMKYSHHDNASDDSHYQWGCISPPRGKCNWQGTHLESFVFEKACLCCDDLCNGKNMDSITGNTIDCRTTPEPSTAMPDEPTTQKPDDSDNNDIIIVGAVLGGALGITLIALIIALCYICKKLKSDKKAESMEFKVRGEK